MFLKKFLLLTKPEIILYKAQQKPYNFEIFLPIKITIFYLNIF